ncbi:5'-3' exonuclease [Kineosporia succinea]|uniref:5'-3' exonuclease n=1 Tax=Kineosporia succinea TaxID=84632 RepID=A0ABT9NW81_9ACTN|nr:5'-3' exonuclease H3TH domain-containing protein [Kineosporia succinea]MDP9824581.1 DNA polymerase-1 [Kineosporia succinea]
MPVPLLLAVDGNSLLHRAHHAMSQGDLRDSTGAPVWALKGLISFLATASARLRPDALVVGFDCAAGESVRRGDYDGYKAGRPEKSEDLCLQLDAAPGFLAAAGITVVVPKGYEADDVMASSARSARRHGWRSTVVTSDRDMFALVDDNTSVLRVMNGGIDGSPLIDPSGLHAQYGVRPDQYKDFAALRGDASDNLPGAFGIGPKRAAKLLAEFDTVENVYAALDDGLEDVVVALVGPAATAALGSEEARANVARNQHLMEMRRDLRIPKIATMALPLDEARLQATLKERDIRLGSSLWSLTGAEPPSWYGERVYGQGPRQRPAAPDRVITLPRPQITKAAKQAAALADAGQMSLF